MKNKEDNHTEGKVTVLLAQAGEQVTGNLSEHWFEVAKCGKYYDWRYGNFEVTVDMLSAMVRNFNDDVLKLKLALDCNHDPDHKAMAWIEELELRGCSMFARFTDWTPEGEKAMRTGEYRYFSIEFEPLELPDDKGLTVIPNVLRGIAATNRPVLKGMEGTFGEKEKIHSAHKAVNNDKGMKNIVKKFAESLLSSEKISGADNERMKMLLSELPEEDQKELKETAEQVEAKAVETENADAEEAKEDNEEQAKKLAEKAKKLNDTSMQLAEAEKRLADLEKNNQTLLAEKKARDTKEVVDSMMLSESNSKGFPAGKRDEVEAMVNDIGIENARKFAAKLSEVVDATGKTEEIGGSEKADKEQADKADMKLAEDRAKDTGKPVHVCLSEIYAEKETSK